MSANGYIPGDGWGGYVLGKVSDTLAEYYERTWLRVHEDSTRTIYVSPNMEPITEPSYVKVLVIPKAVFLAALRLEQAEASRNRALPEWWNNCLPTQQPGPSSVVESEPQEESYTGNGHRDVNSDLPQDESTEVRADEGGPDGNASQPLDLAAFKLGDIQLRILRWLSKNSSEAGQELAWGVDYKSKNNASRRVVFSRALKNLERKGLIERVKHKDQPHSRTRAVRLTPLGLRVAKMIAAAEA